MIELLVVLGIVALLSSFLMPALRAARQAAERTRCAAQLRQLGTAFLMYANSNRGSMPSWSDWHTYPEGGSDFDSPGPGWTEILAPHHVPPDSPLYNCPSFTPEETRYNYFLAAKWAGHNGRHATRFTDVTMSSRFVLSGDVTNTILYPPEFGTNGHLVDDCDRDDYGNVPALAFPGDEGGFLMHRGGNNVLFDDGHVQLFPAFDTAAMTFHPNRMLAFAEVTADEGAPE